MDMSVHGMWLPVQLQRIKCSEVVCRFFFLFFFSLFSLVISFSFSLSAALNFYANKYRAFMVQHFKTICIVDVRNPFLDCLGQLPLQPRDSFFFSHSHSVWIADWNTTPITLYIFTLFGMYYVPPYIRHRNMVATAAAATLQNVRSFLYKLMQSESTCVCWHF